MPQRDLTETKIFSIKQLWLIGVVVVGGTAALTMGYFQLDAKASAALDKAKTLSEEVKIVTCLVRQQNYHQFYKRIPEWECK